MISLNDMFGLSEIRSVNGPNPAGFLSAESASVSIFMDSPDSTIAESRKRLLLVMRDGNADDLSLEFARRLAGGAGVEVHSIRPATADPAGEVRRLALALEIDLVCIVTRGGPGVMTLFLNGDDDKFLRSVPCPVVSISDSLIARWQTKPSIQGRGAIQRILVPIVGSQACLRAVHQAADVAENSGAVVDILEVDETGRGSRGRRRSSIIKVRGMRDAAPRGSLTCLAKRIIPKRVLGQTTTSLGLPAFYATVQAAKARDCDLIVMGVPTRRWRMDGRIDVNTERILRGSPCPVICAPEREDGDYFMHKEGREHRPRSHSFEFRSTISRPARSPRRQCPDDAPLVDVRGTGTLFNESFKELKQS